MHEEEYNIAERELINNFATMTEEEAMNATVMFQAKYRTLGDKVTKNIKEALDFFLILDNAHHQEELPPRRRLVVIAAS